MCEEKKHLVRVHYHDHTGTDEVKLFQSLKDAAEGIRKDLENCQKKFFSDGNFCNAGSRKPYRDMGYRRNGILYLGICWYL